ncbi:MAG: flagellar biosynthetic protein FliO [Candidatus Latescibacteria bacterium]|nr:flagellar biosynthetic protein FliO [Candidatus Latescibacterota bacterium]
MRSTAWAVGLSCLLGLSPAGATAAPDTAATSSPAVALPSPPDTLKALPPAPALADEDVPYLAMMVKLGLGLALVILLAWGAVFLLRKSAFGKQFGGTGSNIRVVERFYLGPKRAIYLVEIGGRPLALGVTEAAITPLTQWQPGELDLSPRPASSSSFAAQFRNLIYPQPGGQEG